MLKKNIWASFQRIIVVGSRDPRSGKNLFRIPDPGPGVKRHRIPDPDPQHWVKYIYNPGNVVPYFLNTQPPTFHLLLMKSCRWCWCCCWLRHSLFVYNCCWPGWSVWSCTSDTFCAWCKFSGTYVALHKSLILALKQVTHKVKFVVSFLIWYSTYERIY